MLTPKHVQSFRTAFNIAHALFDSLDIAAWRALLASVAALDSVLASPATAAGNVTSSSMSRGPVGAGGGAKGDPGRDADLAILEAAAAQLFATTGSGKLSSAMLVIQVLQDISVANGVTVHVRVSPLYLISV